MINAINGISNTNNLKPAFKANEEAVTVTETVVHKEIISPSSDIMSSYHRGGLNFNQILNVRPLLPTIIHPKAVKSINGERIYTSDGESYNLTGDFERDSIRDILVQNTKATIKWSRNRFLLFFDYAEEVRVGDNIVVSYNNDNPIPRSPYFLLSGIIVLIDIAFLLLRF